MKPEQKFNQWLRENLWGDFHRIENAVESGTPDINVCYQGKEIWIESKVYVDGEVLIRPRQYAWSIRRAINGGNVFIIAKHEVVISVWKYRPHPLQIRKTNKYLSVIDTRDLVAVDAEQLNTFLFTDKN